MSEALDRWVEEGLVSPRQAERIRGVEAARTGGRRVPVLAEALGYLGAAVATVTAIAIAAQLWPGLPTGWRLALPTLTAAVLYTGGRRVRGRDDPAAERLLGFLWLLSAGAATVAVVVATRRVMPVPSDLEFLVAGAGMLVYGGWLWRAHPAAPQELVVWLAALATLLGGVTDAGLDAWSGPLVWALGAAWGLLGHLGVLPPRRTAYGLGALAGLAGPQIWTETSPGPGPALGLATAAALFAAGAWVREPVLPGLGVAATLLFLPQVLGPRLAGGTVTLVVLLAAGLALLGGVLVAVGRRPSP